MFPIHRTICGQFLLRRGRGKSPNKEWKFLTLKIQANQSGVSLNILESYRGVHGVLSVETCNVTCPMQKERKQQFKYQGKEGNKKIVIT